MLHVLPSEKDFETRVADEINSVWHFLHLLELASNLPQKKTKTRQKYRKLLEMLTFSLELQNSKTSNKIWCIL